MSLRYLNAKYSQDRGREVVCYFRDQSRQHATVRRGHRFWKTIAIVEAKWMKQPNPRTAQTAATKIASLDYELQEEITQVASNKQRTQTTRRKARKKRERKKSAALYFCCETATTQISTRDCTCRAHYIPAHTHSCR